MAADRAEYDPFLPGPFEVRRHELTVADDVRGRSFPTDVWRPGPGRARPLPLVLFSHHSGGHRRTSTFLCRHLASHGYVVAAMDHSEVVAAELAPRARVSEAERAQRVAAIIASRLPDLRCLLDHLLAAMPDELDAGRIGLAGHSFGGWAVLAMADADRRVCSVVAMAPGGSRERRPGLLPLELSFDADRRVPTLYLAAEDDVMTSLAGVRELFDRTLGPKRLFVLRRADHEHFVDDVEGAHEAVRAAVFPPEAAWIPAAMRPVAELSSGEQAHLFARCLGLAHFDATLRGREEAERFLAGEVVGELAARGVEALAN